MEPIDAYIHRGIQEGKRSEENAIFMVVPMENAAVEAIAAVFRAHNAEFDAALAPFGLSHKDMLMPDWQRPMRKSDVEALEWLGEQK